MKDARSIFFGLERKHISNNTIKQLKRENGTLTSSNAEILEEQYNFYKKLYTKDDISEEFTQSYLDSITSLKCLKEEEKKMEGGLKEWECRNAAIGMKLNKAQTDCPQNSISLYGMK